jgi:quercetin dioxygenase-like cupin family protein
VIEWMRMAWETIVLQPLEGEKRLFKIGLMTFNASSTKTDGQFAFIETELPPGSKVERHHHPEAEMFYIVSGTFDFWIDDTAEAIACGSGAFLCIPPDVPHSFANSGDRAGRIFGMLAPCRPEGLESFFRAMSIPVNDRVDVPDLNQTVEHVQQIIAKSRATGAGQS